MRSHGWFSFLFLLTLSPVLSTVAVAGSGVWTSGGPYGGEVDALAFNPATPTTLYAGSSSAHGVINDGGSPGQRTGDGSYVPGVTR